ncbi:Zinc finger protein, partial [Aphis craccivora]
KKQSGVFFTCSVCIKTFYNKSNLIRHEKNIPGIVKVLVDRQPAQPNATPIVTQSVIQYAPPAVNIPQRCIQIAPQMFVPDTPASGSNISTDISLSDDDICMIAMDAFENEEVR